MVVKVALNEFEPADHKFGSVNPKVFPKELPEVQPVAGEILQTAGCVF